MFTTSPRSQRRSAFLSRRVPLRAGAKGHLACTLALVAHDPGRAPGSRFPRGPFPLPRRQHPPRSGLLATPGQLPDPRRLPSERVRGQRSADVPSGRDPPAQLRRDEGKGDSPRPPFISPWVSSALQASPPVRPSRPKAAACFPELGPV